MSLNWNTYNKYVNNKDKYFFQTPINKFFDLVSEFGNPTLLDNKIGGMAIWKSDQPSNFIGGIYQRIDLIDNPIYNSYPRPHIGHLYTYYKYKIPISKLSQVLSLTGDIKYDSIENIIIVRGMSLGYCNNIIVFIIKLCRGDISWHQITSDDLFKKSITFQNLTNDNNVQYNKGQLKGYAKMSIHALQKI